MNLVKESFSKKIKITDLINSFIDKILTGTTEEGLMGKSTSFMDV